MLRQIMAFGQSREQRDVLLLGGLTTLGASLAQTLRFLYGGKWFFSSLQTFVVAPPASGKGVLAWTRMLVQPIHDEIRATVAEEMKRYKKEMTSFNSLGREKAKAEEPEMPLNRMVLYSPATTPVPVSCRISSTRAAWGSSARPRRTWSATPSPRIMAIGAR